ncbi:hypothetical protein Belba_2404 [Belliella baltica DSM 15883]|uniref:Uncharacterized protein n=1 Tax=Belliella baltica (strain DSM 15883 / CIP 108006 / LMG 21964 / BA134) TaxID=866536 RepID=I3Z6U6_BELBD|nr:hypothetical protein [Belliella baltica]AFL84964.1 hypothetical protein Belba_2404 [Belliella baltica DSM 15883]
MNLDFNIFSLTLLISGIVVTALSAIIINRLNDYVRWFAFTMLLVSLWSNIKSELNVGSEFEFSLPIYKDELIIS